MDHKTFLQNMPKHRLIALNQQSTKAGLLHLAGHAGTIAVIGSLIAAKVPYWPVLLVPQGIGICFLFTLQHEATHKTPFAHMQLNEWIGHIIGALICQPFIWFRYSHLAHHRHTNIPGKDPELEGGTKPQTLPWFLWHISRIPHWFRAA